MNPRSTLILPPGFDPSYAAPGPAEASPHHLGTDPVGRGEWRRTNNTVALTQALHDVKQRAGMSGAELFGAMVENVIAAIQAGVAPVEWPAAADAVCTHIRRRCSAR